MHARPIRRVLLCTALAVTMLTGCGAPGVPGSGAEEGEPGGAVTDEQAAAILQRVLEADVAARSGAADAEGQVSATYAGEGHRAAKAATQLIAAGVQPKSAGPPTDVKVLANSRGVSYPRFIVGASAPGAKQLPVVHLLVATNPGKPYRLAMSAQMLPGAQINAFPSRAEGAKVVTDGSDMSIKPVDLLKAYADGLAGKESQLYEKDTFLEQILAGVEKQQQALKGKAEFQQTHQVMPDPVVALREANGDTLVLGAIERTSNFTIKPGSQLETNAFFKAFAPKRSFVVQQMRFHADQFVVFAVPKQGKARLVAATEQMVEASGY